MAQGVLLGRVACNRRRYRVEILALLAREIEIGEDDAVLEEGYAGHPE